jgi:hypothetical protein
MFIGTLELVALGQDEGPSLLKREVGAIAIEVAQTDLPMLVEVVGLLPGPLVRLVVGGLRLSCSDHRVGDLEVEPPRGLGIAIVEL